MKRDCKNIDLTDPETLLPHVRDCVLRHYTRWDFKRLLTHTGKMPKELYNEAVKTHNKLLLEDALAEIARETACRIRNRDLKLPPVHIEERVDNSSFKVRQIGRESAMQQVFDHIAVGLSAPIFKRRIVPQQASSVKGRGQIYGVKAIQKAAAKDYRAARWAKAHHIRYAPKLKYQVKCDIKNCYGSARHETFMALFERDCGNKDLLWLWEALLSSHRVNGYQGFMIGALVSQWAMQYMMSFIYRYISGLHTKRRGKTIKLVNFTLIYMDDMLFMGGARRNLLKAVKSLKAFAFNKLGFTIKDNWHIAPFKDSPIDMMGFVVHADGTVTVRPRVFLRLRRQALRYLRTGRMALHQAVRICSYIGYFKQKRLQLKNVFIYKKLGLERLFREARKTVSAYGRKKNGKGIFFTGTCGNTVYGTA